MTKNPIAKDLRSSKYRKRVVKSQKLYNRKKDWKGEWRDDYKKPMGLDK